MSHPTCICGKKSGKTDSLCPDHWYALPSSLKTAWRQAEREGGESFVLLTGKIRDYTNLQLSIDSTERRRSGLRNRYVVDDLARESKRLRDRQLEILRRCGLREALAA